MNENGGIVRFMYATVLGRYLLKLLMSIHADRLAVRFLCSPLSRPVIARYAAKNGVAMTKEELRSYRTFRDFFARKRGDAGFDENPEHLISPCDGWLSVFPVTESSSFAIKGSRYRVEDLLRDEALAENYRGGTCLVFRLCASDYHHYCYIDDGRQGPNHFIPGQLHSVRPIACENYPVFVLNRRCWCLMDTVNFGPVVQTEIGAFVVGGIANDSENISFRRGGEKGHFELSGSTIVLLVEPRRIRLLPELEARLADGQEIRVEQGMWIANRGGA